MRENIVTHAEPRARHTGAPLSPVQAALTARSLYAASTSLVRALHDPDSKLTTTDLYYLATRVAHLGGLVRGVVDRLCPRCGDPLFTAGERVLNLCAICQDDKLARFEIAVRAAGGRA